MDSPLVDVEPIRQADILRHQLESVRDALDSGDDTGFLAALMIEWHACYYPAAFKAVRRECLALIDDAKSRPSYWGLGRTLTAPIELALAVNRWGDPLNQLPRGFDVHLWSHELKVSHRMRTCLYLAAPLIDAETLFDPYVHSWIMERPRDELAFVIGLCKGGFEVLWRLRAHLPAGEAVLDDTIREQAILGTVTNPFAAEVMELTSYMFRQSIRVTDGLGSYADAQQDESRYFNRQVGILASVGLGPSFVLTASIDYAEVDEYHRLGEDVVPLVAAQIVGSSWRRLVRYTDGACRVEKYDCENGGWKDSAMPVGEFITRVRGAAA